MALPHMENYGSRIGQPELLNGINFVTFSTELILDAQLAAISRSL
jgi:hypothetical protein